MAKVSFEYRDGEPIIKGDFNAVLKESAEGRISDGPTNIMIWMAAVLVHKGLVRVESDEVEEESDGSEVN